MVYKNEKSFIFQVSIGVLLGDASIQKNTSKKVKKHRLKFLQGAKHKLYLYHLYTLFKDEGLVLSKPHFNEERNCFSFQTIFDTRFNLLADIVLDNTNPDPAKAKKKKLNIDYFLNNMISPLSLAFWFMDDGGLLCYNKDWQRNGLLLNTQGFTLEEVEILCNNLEKNYNIKCWVKANKNKPVIAISGNSSKQLVNQFSSFMHESMLYKLPKRLL